MEYLLKMPGILSGKDQCMIPKLGIWHWASFPLKDNASMIFIFQEGSVENGVESQAVEKSSVIFLSNVDYE